MAERPCTELAAGSNKGITMGASAVQFRGIDNVVKAYENQEIPAFSIFCGKNPLKRYAGDSMEEGAAELEEFLRMLREGGSDSAYQLRVYENLGKGQTIKAGTDFDLAFNFKLFDYSAGETDLNGYRPGRLSDMDERIKRIEAAVSSEAPQEEEEKISGVQGVIAGILNNPQFQQLMMGKLVSFIDTLTGGKNKLGAVAGIPDDMVKQDQTQATDELQFHESYSSLGSEQQAKLNEALRILIRLDRKIGTHLEGVAKIAENDPLKYKMLTGML